MAPDAPAIGLAEAGDESALVRWTAPGFDGGSAIYGYEVQAVDPETGIVVGVDAAAPDATSMTMTGLSNGLPYTFWVRAVNAAGASDYSGLSNVVIPAAAHHRRPPPPPRPRRPRPRDPGTGTATPALPPTRTTGDRRRPPTPAAAPAPGPRLRTADRPRPTRSGGTGSGTRRRHRQRWR